MKKIISIVIISILLSCGSSTKYSVSSKSNNNSKKSSIEKCLEGDCVDGLGTYQFSNGDKYNGYFRNNKKNGYGIYYYKNGDMAYGGFRKDEFHGVLYVNWKKSGYYLKASYNNGTKDGHFDYYDSEGEMIDYQYYINGVKSSKPDGEVRPNKQNFEEDYLKASVIKSESFYINSYINLDFTPSSSVNRITLYEPGHSKAYYLIDNDNNRYELSHQYGFEGDGIDGFGSRNLDKNFSVVLHFYGLDVDNIESLSLIEGDCEVGCWHFNNLELPKIEGCIQGDCRKEFGVLQKRRLSFGFLFGNSDSKIETYEGFFKNGEYHGEGMLTISDGNIYIGSFNEGYFEGEGTIIYKNGNKYIGDIYDEIREGYGIFYQDNYLAFKGTWKYDEPYEGIGYNSDGSVQHNGRYKDWRPAY